MSTSTTNTSDQRDLAPYLDDPVRFAAHLFSCGAAIEAHAAGVRFGIAAEHLRRSLLAAAG